MPVRQNDCFDDTQIDAEPVSILLESGRLRPGVKQHRVGKRTAARRNEARKAVIGAANTFA
jgi:hypothetical protein